MELVSGRGIEVTSACRLFGRSRQAYYRLKAVGASIKLSERCVLETVSGIRCEDPGIGCRKLWLMLCSVFGRDRMPGRDVFFRLLRRRGLVLSRPKPRRTTASNHRYRKWKNLVRSYRPETPNRLWVSDITYIPLERGGTCYLHLVTDAYSHKIIGWRLSSSLRAEASLDALSQAIAQATAMRGSDRLDSLIHHSDRGVQYCCDAYVAELQRHGIAISMTEDYNPTDNAVAERVNGIIKQEAVSRRPAFRDMAQAAGVIGRFIDFYNRRRPHMSIGYKTPEAVHTKTGEQYCVWRRGKTHAGGDSDAKKSNFATLSVYGSAEP